MNLNRVLLQHQHSVRFTGLRLIFILQRVQKFVKRTGLLIVKIMICNCCAPDLLAVHELIADGAGVGSARHGPRQCQALSTPVYQAHSSHTWRVCV